MAKEICISSTPHETRLAILEDDQLAEIYYERENEYTLAGSIYNGRVTRVLPGMQSAFVDLGLERDAFLYVTDFIELEDQEETDELEKAAASGAGQAPREVRHPHGDRENGGRQEERGHASADRRTDGVTAARNPRRRKRRSGRQSIESRTRQPRLLTEQSGLGAGTDEAGARRWRGRRRRRGGRGPSAQPASRSEFEPVSESWSEAPDRSGAALRDSSLRSSARARRAGIMRQRPLCFPASRFRSTAARPARKRESCTGTGGSAPPVQAHPSPLR